MKLKTGGSQVNDISMKLTSVSWSLPRKKGRGLPDDEFVFLCDDLELFILRAALKIGLLCTPKDTQESFERYKSELDHFRSVLEKALEKPKDI